MSTIKETFNRLGGVPAVAAILGVHKTRVYSWARSKDGSPSDEMIPSWHIKTLLDHAHENNIQLSADDFFEPKEKGAAA